MTLKGIGILKPEEVAEELEEDHLRIKHCEHFEKAKVAEVLAEVYFFFVTKETRLFLYSPSCKRGLFTSRRF